MKSKNVRIRLYRMQDYDLYRMYYDPDFDLHGAFRAVVKAYANNEPAPVIRVDHLKQLEKGSPVHIPLSFTVHGDREVEMLEAATKNWKNANNFCKSLLRRSLVGLNAIYFDGEDEGKYPDFCAGNSLDDAEVQIAAEVSAPGKKKKTTAQKKKPRRTEKKRDQNNTVKVFEPDISANEESHEMAEFDPFAAVSGMIMM